MNESPLSPGLIDSYLATARSTSLRASPDGCWLAVRSLRLSEDGRSLEPGLDLVDATDTALRRRIRCGLEVGPEFYFASATELLVRGRPSSAHDWAAWVIDLADDSARCVAEFPGDVTDLVLSRDGVLVAKVKVLSTHGLDAAAAVHRQREDLGTSGILHEAFPVRAWDRDLGPHRSVLVRIADWRSQSPATLVTPDIDRELDGQFFDVSPDGGLIATGWHLSDTPGARRSAVVLVDAEGGRRFLADQRDVHFEKPQFSPNGRLLLCERVQMPTLTDPPDHALWVIDLETGVGRVIGADLDLWPILPRWSADSSTVYFVAEERGRRPVFCVELDSDDAVLRLTEDGSCYSELTVTKTEELWALRSSLAEPPTIAALDPGGIRPLSPSPIPSAPAVDLPGTMAEVTVQATDGQELRGSLLLPAGSSPVQPAPLLLLVHGGPEQSWLDWAPWGYNPWLFVQQGYAVLLPDPALSTGYGQHFIRRGWAGWGGKAYSDLMTFVDAIAARPEIDEPRMGVVGHSFGGYMANWIAGHTTRFRAVVSHAGLWDLPAYGGTTDRPHHWERQFGDPDEDPTRYVENSPERFKDEIRTPMLLVHGDRDYRVPVSESIRLWRDLTKRGIPGKFLYFPDENHYILRPGNVRTWYATMLSFLGEHVLGRPAERPEGI